MNLATFLAHAVKLEYEAMHMSERLANIVELRGERDVEAFYREMVENSRKHLQDALDRAGYAGVAELPAGDYLWPDGFSPECSRWSDVKDITDLDRAMELSLDAERRAMGFYRQVAVAARDPNVQDLAAAFAAEEVEHVEALERFMGLRPY